MNKIIFFLCMIVSSTRMTAQPVDANTARERAASFMAERGLSLEEQDPSASSHRAVSQANPLYIFNTKGDNGFVVISGDDRTEEVLGYTTSGSYSSDDMPPAFAEWLESMAEQIKSMSDTVTAKRRASSSNQRPAIEPLAKTKWGQNDPYNLLCPIVNGKRTPSGCGATVVAQLMYYYQYPSQATTTIPSYKTEHAGTMPELVPITFDYEKMELDYSKVSYSEESAKAISELMLYAGCAMTMDYDDGGSGTTMDRLKKALLTYFDYDNRTTCTIKRSDYTTHEWNDMIYNELAQDRPVIYMGVSEHFGAHVFLCDGYKDQALYHINWGWAGSYDGWFRLSIMDPYYQYESMACGFSLYQEAIIGLQPASEDSKEMKPVSSDKSSGKAELEVIDVQYDNLITSTQKVKVTVANTGNGDFTGNLYLYASKDNAKPNKYTHRCGLGIEPGDCEKVDLFFNPTEEGTWNLWLTTDKDVIYTNQVNITSIGDTVNLKLNRHRIEPVSETSARLTVSFSNISTGTLYSSIWIMVYENNTLVDKIHSAKQTLYPENSMELTFTLKNLEVGKSYTIDVGYFPIYGTTTMYAFRIHYSHHSATMLATPEHETVLPVTYYNLNGMRIDQPTRGLNLMRLSNGKTIKSLK